MVRRLVQDEHVDAERLQLREVGARALARRERRARALDVIRAQPELRERASAQRPSRARSEPSISSRSDAVACVRRPVLPDRSDHRAPADAARACDESDLAEEHRQQRRLPGAVRPCDREPLTGREVDVDGPEAERAALRRPHPSSSSTLLRLADAGPRASGSAPTARTASQGARSARGDARPGAPSSRARASRGDPGRPSCHRARRPLRAPPFAGCRGAR